MNRTRTPFVVACVAGVVLLELLRLPVRTTALRAAIAFAAATVFVAAVVGLWRVRHLGKALLGAGAAALVWTLATLPLVPVEPGRFLSALQSLDGVPYVWGGETSGGLDCSGLIRVALRDCCLERLRPGAALRIWWRDQPAARLGVAWPEVFDAGRPAPCIRDLDPRSVPPGAIVVPAGGSHVLACLGDGVWIQASPVDGRVTIKPATAPDRWFGTPITVYPLQRW